MFLIVGNNNNAIHGSPRGLGVRAPVQLSVLQCQPGFESRRGIDFFL